MLLFYVLVFWPQGMWNLSSLTRDRTCIPCIERQILINGITRAVPCGNSLNILIITAFCMDLLQITTSSLCCLSIDLLVGIFHEIVVSQLERTHTHTHTHYLRYRSCCCAVAQSCPTLRDPTDSMAASPVLHCLPEFAQIHVH